MTVTCRGAQVTGSLTTDPDAADDVVEATPFQVGAKLPKLELDTD